MRKLLGISAAVAVGITAGGLSSGCQQHPPQPANQQQVSANHSAGGVTPSVLNVSPIARKTPRFAGPTRGPAVTPPVDPIAPLITTAPLVTVVPPVDAARPRGTASSSGGTPIQASAHIAGKTYTVRKGDTLFRIAKSKYGDGKKWTRIASANPGLSAKTLQAGQSIVIP